MGILSMIRRTCAPLLLGILLCPSLAWAQPDARDDAHQHYEKGLSAFDDERFQDAADEFEAAYRILPAFAVLYNLGRVYVALGRPVEAVHAFETYLAQGASSIDPARAREVRAEVERQRSHVGTISLRTVPPDAEVRVDGKLVGKTPLADPVVVAEGKHTVEALLTGYAPLVRDLTVAGMAKYDMELRLEVVTEAEGTPPPPPPASAPVPPPPSPPPAAVVVELAPPPAPPPVPAPAGESGSFGMRSWGFVVGAVGVAAGGAGAVIAVLGVKNASDARDRAAASTAPSMAAAYNQARSDFDSAKGQTVLGWTIAGVGAGVLLGGALLVAIAPAQKSARLPGVTPWVGLNAGGVGFSGVW